MLVSLNWLRDYVPLQMPIAELESRLMMSGLNHEATRQAAADDVVIDLEVTSNRPDCLGHLGVAREIAVLWELPLAIPRPAPSTAGRAAGELCGLTIECPDFCRRYIARVLRGVRVGASPKWLTSRLDAIGIPSINNVVDATNYVLMECGQPLHAFDLTRLEQRQIVVRRARAGEVLTAIDHRNYALSSDMCVIADARRPVALGGIMGGAETEVTPETTEVLLESAVFDPLAIRNAARRLNLHSASSYRFERGIDPAAVEWASLRCAEMILDLAGGELADGSVDVGAPPPAGKPIELRFARLERVLGIEIESAAARRILRALGLSEKRAGSASAEFIPPSWRGDLTREIDLIEEVGRIHGYEKIPEDVRVPMVPSRPRMKDWTCSELRHIVTAAGFSEAMTLSAVDASWAELPNPWTAAAPLKCRPAVLKRADCLRQSLVPSLLEARRTNEALSNWPIELFEVARVYLPAGSGPPQEEEVLALTSGRGFAVIKGVVDAVVGRLAPGLTLQAVTLEHPLIDPHEGCGLKSGERLVAYMGDISATGRERFDLRHTATVAELMLGPLLEQVQPVRRAGQLSPYQAVDRDLNMVFDEQVRWADVCRVVREAAGQLLESLHYQETYRDPKRLGPGRKSFLMRLSLRAADTTLTREQADRVCQDVEEALDRKLGGRLRGVEG
jgi:phenylalanyl-tRNA synthetase beta chain